MAKKKSKKRRSSGGPSGRPGAATKAQAKQSQKSKKSGAKGGKKDAAEPRTVFDLAKGTSQAQRVTIAAVIVVLAAVGGLVAGRSAGSNPERYNDESAAASAARDSEDFEVTSDETQLTAAETGVICVPAGDAASPTKGPCGTPAPTEAGGTDADADGSGGDTGDTTTESTESTTETTAAE